MNESAFSRRDLLQTSAGALMGALGSAAIIKSNIPAAVAAEAAALNFDSYLDIPMFHNDVEAVVDKWNIKELVQMDRWCRDNVQWDKMEACYLPDSLVNVSWYSGDGREFVKASAAQSVSASAYSAPKHKIFNTHIWLNGTKAIAETQALLLSPYVNTYRDFHYSQFTFARLFERVEKVDGYWGIRQFDTIYERGFIVPEFPNEQFTIDPAEFEGYRESYKVICWELANMGMETNPEQPGEDRPDLIDALYQGASEWLKA